MVETTSAVSASGPINENYRWCISRSYIVVNRNAFYSHLIGALKPSSGVFLGRCFKFQECSKTYGGIHERYGTSSPRLQSVQSILPSILNGRQAGANMQTRDRPREKQKDRLKNGCNIPSEHGIWIRQPKVQHNTPTPDSITTTTYYHELRNASTWLRLRRKM